MLVHSGMKRQSNEFSMDTFFYIFFLYPLYCTFQVHWKYMSVATFLKKTSLTCLILCCLYMQFYRKQINMNLATCNVGCCTYRSSLVLLKCPKPNLPYPKTLNLNDCVNKVKCELKANLFNYSYVLC